MYINQRHSTVCTEKEAKVVCISLLFLPAWEPWCLWNGTVAAVSIYPRTSIDDRFVVLLIPWLLPFPPHSQAPDLVMALSKLRRGLSHPETASLHSHLFLLTFPTLVIVVRVLTWQCPPKLATWSKLYLPFPVPPSSSQQEEEERAEPIQSTSPTPHLLGQRKGR